MQVTFPYLAGWRSLRFWTVGNALTPQEGITGAETIVPVPRARWMASGEAVIRGEAGFLQWQAFIAQMEGMVGTTLVPCQTIFGARDRNGRRLSFGQTGGVQSAQTFEHFGMDGGAVQRLINVFDAPLRSTEISVTRHDSTGIRPGHFFSLGERLHQVQASWDAASDRQRIKFHPPLREAVAAEAPVEVVRPVCKMRFASETEGVLPQSFGAPLARITVNFVEVI